MQFLKNKKIIKILIDLGSKANVITLAYIKQLDFRTKKTDV